LGKPGEGADLDDGQPGGLEGFGGATGGNDFDAQGLQRLHKLEQAGLVRDAHQRALDLAHDPRSLAKPRDRFNAIVRGSRVRPVAAGFSLRPACWRPPRRRLKPAATVPGISLLLTPDTSRRLL